MRGAEDSINVGLMLAGGITMLHRAGDGCLNNFERDFSNINSIRIESVLLTTSSSLICLIHCVPKISQMRVLISLCSFNTDKCLNNFY